MGRIVNWPSRRLQVGVLLLLTVLVALRAYLPPFTPQRRAEKLYADACFLAREQQEIPGEYACAGAVERVEAALKLSPGNSLYEQALVCYSPRKDLTALLRTRHLGPQARALAAELSYQNAILERKPSSTARLERLAALRQADPMNALSYYWQAQLLADQGRFDAAVAAVEAGNRMGSLHFYQPASSRKLMDATAFPAFNIGGVLFHEFGSLRELSRTLADHANNCLRQRKVDEARRTLEAMCRMGVTASTAEPRLLDTFSIGTECFTMGWSSLEPLYQDFGPSTALANYQRINTILNRGQWETKTFTTRMLEEYAQRFIRLLCVPLCLQYDAIYSLILALLTLLVWLVAVRARKSKGEALLRFAPWGEGWLIRRFTAVYTASLGLLLGMVFFPPTAAMVKNDSALLFCLRILPLLLATGCVLLALRRTYEAHTGERTGMIRWFFKAPAAVKAWTRQWLSAAFAAQALFLAGGYLMLLLFFQPIYGAYPWQLERLPMGSYSLEQAFVSKIAVELRKCGETPPAPMASTPRRSP